MKKVKLFIIAILGVVMMVGSATAQVPANYKATKIDASGKVTSSDGIHLGWVTKDGIIKDTLGNKVAFIDNEGNLIDGKNGKKIGKAAKNGNFKSYESKTPDKGWIVSDAKNGICTVKDSEGNLKGEVHENYKQQAACTIHCLGTKK